MRALAELLAERCARLPAVEAAWLVQIFAPLSEEFTSALAALELAGPLPPDAFAGWPAEHPLVVMALGDDAVSRLVRLTRPAYTAPGRDLRALGRTLAAALDGRVLEVPSDREFPALAIALPGHEVPLYLRAFGGRLRINAADGAVWDATSPDAARLVPEISAHARAWVADHAGEVTPMALALELAAALAAAFAERWTIDVPGTSVPAEMWLHGPEHEAASVGVFADGRAIVWLGREPRAVTADQVVAAVTEQRARYQRHLGAGAELSALAVEVTAGLAARLPGAWTWSASGRASHADAPRAEIFAQTAGAREPTVVTLFLADDGIRAHAGLAGADGWEDVVTASPAQLDAIAEAVARRLRTLTVHDLRVGTRYRVTSTLQQLEAGQTVRYLGLDDIDNHHGEYGFATGDGRKLVVAGDCSEPGRGPLAEVHRYLEPLDD